ncbi:MAG: isocitrate/isopropylmalate dehydrogenase family protein [Bdellovibrionales bacterium]|nr:isocitrate/isopropylmalate dehydrogenase family protein [Bdellovibrionales bacterium]
MSSTPKKVALLRGDGIGPEIADAVLTVLDAAGAAIEWVEVPAGEPAIAAQGDPLPEETVETIRSLGCALKSPIATPIGSGFRSVNVRLRKELDLFANYRPVRTLPGVKSRFDGIDLIFFRENTEGLYSGLEHEIVPGVVTSLKVSTRRASLRIAEFAFAHAERLRRRKITAVHKANILKLSDGLALECYRSVAEQHPSIEYEERIIDATAMQLVMYPERFDVLLMENLYGDILSDLGAGLVGGLGLAPSANYGEQCGVFEAVHGTAPDIAGKGIANPTALLLSAVELLRYISQDAVADRVSTALLTTLREQRLTTPDLGGVASTMEFATHVNAHLS